MISSAVADALKKNGIVDESKAKESEEDEKVGTYLLSLLNAQASKASKAATKANASATVAQAAIAPPAVTLKSILKRVHQQD